MRKIIFTISVICVLLLGCAVAQDSAQGAEENVLPDRLFETYYLSSEEPVYTYLQNKSIQRFFNMWFKEYIGEDIEAHWNYDTLAPVQMLDHKFNPISRPGEKFYTCTFSTDDGRYGYIIISYGEGKEGPYISKWSLNETTPYQYDLRANSSQIGEALNKMDIDVSTASAMRAEWIDTDKKRGDRIILFTDGKNDKYVCYFGDGDYTLHKGMPR